MDALAAQLQITLF